MDLRRTVDSRNIRGLVLAAVCAGLFGVYAWWDDFGFVLRGLIPLILIVVGLIAVGSGLVAQPDTQERREPL